MNMKTIALIGAALVLVAGCAYFAMPKTDVTVSKTATNEFVIDTRMERVRKILVRTNAIKQLVAGANATLVDQQWNEIGVDKALPLLKREWEVESEGELTVRVDNAILGSHELVLEQKAQVEAEKLVSINELTKPVGPFQIYRTKLTLTPDENGNAKFQQELELKTETTANSFFFGSIESGVKKAAQASLEKQEKLLRELVKEHADELIILPERDN